MIFCKDKIYAKVWSIKKEDKYIDLRISTSEKDRDGNYVNSTWFPRLIGHAFNSLKDELKEGDRLIITKSKLTNESYTKDGVVKSSFKFVVLEAEIDAPASETPEAAPAPASTPASATPVASDSCPW